MVSTQAQREHYQRNKDQYRERFRNRRNAIRKIVQDAKAKPCTDCGIEYPYYVMQFDHVRGQKVGNIGRMVSDLGSLQAILVEIDKCDVVCSNCHASRTYLRSSMDEQLSSKQ